MNLFDLSRQIGQLKKEGKYKEALSYFKDNKGNFTKEQIAGNEYIIADILTCLRKLSFLEAGFKFLNLYSLEIKGDTKERILSSYGWLLWSQYKAENQIQNSPEEDYHFEDEEEDSEAQDFHYSKTELLQKIEKAILYLIATKNDFNQTLISNLFSVVLKSEKKKATPNWKLINDFCEQFDPTDLSKSCDTIQVERKGQSKDMELASDFENWYAYKTKALMKLGQWEECFNTSKEALETIEKFHYSNDIWISRRIALSKKNLGNTDDTINELESILKKKKEWFIQKELAELYLEKNETEKAFKFSIEAINNFGPLEFKVDLLFLMGQIHQKKNESELAFKHFTLSKLIRVQEGWNIPQKLYNELSGSSDPEIPISDFNKVKSELKRYWKSFDNTKDSKSYGHLKGMIVRILNDNDRGKDGFLENKGKEMYFSVSSNFHLTPSILPGTSVLYTVIPDPKGKGDKAKILKVIR
ncbi:hypothetical protein FK178_02730 [Antarcticibacterium arcticum]|uniref:Uncharacterized protein n=1 Tax=Antarcticibacterium arcticum TaxID=2585771 RepID=A0A5B8YG06_9FLAO|nr:hypothetical protein [Antarcticibacterium arcticum]QED36694.1 hypothetical protein FK178_02730 [Antarcticibacterium arcticum]